MASAEVAPSLLRVLIVEDNPVIRDLLTHGVRRLRAETAGCPPIDVIEVDNGAAAWEHVETGGVDLVVVDLYLPVLGGIELITRIRETPKIAATKILAMSASFTDAKARSLGAGADNFMQKPLRLVDLLDHLRSLLGKSFRPTEG